MTEDPGSAGPRDARQWLLCGVAVLAVVAATTSCGPKGGGGGSHSVTGPEAERLSTVRFTAGLAGGARFAAVLSGRAGQYESMSGQVDWKGHLAEATLTTKRADGTAGHFTIVWNQKALAAKDLDTEVLQGKAGWQTRPLDPERSTFDRAVWTLLAIPSDRPENPMLLASGGARWLRRDRVGETSADVFRGPGQRSEQQQATAAATAAPEFWVDDSGQLIRFQAPIENGMFSSDFSGWGKQEITDSAELAGAGDLKQIAPNGGS
ncbi:hypothetical protein ACIRPK_13850 [Kitasatospora sp. NPDC101801]|uniref:hypothetical protein n=1 Tax=Kitasatospora sp. NPDC101801 TaxID=3364103 RepID=UPI0037FADE1D